MRALRVVIVFHQSLMLEGLVHHLEERRDLEVVGLDPSTTDVAARLGELSPDVVIFDSENVSAWPDLAGPQLLVTIPESKVIDVSLHRNEMTVSEKRNVIIRKFEDLLEAIDPPRPVVSGRNARMRKPRRATVEIRRPSVRRRQ